MLKGRDYEIRFAADGLEAIKVAKAFDPALILMDVLMPGMNGIEACEQIRSVRLATRPTIIMVSGVSEHGIIAEALCRGADEFVMKPVNNQELLARIDAQMRIHDFYQDVELDRRDLETILDITKAVSSSLDPNAVLRTIVCRIAKITEASRCSILLVPNDEEAYVLASHDDPDIESLRIDLTKYPEIREALRTRSLLVVDDMTDSPVMKEIKELLFGFDGISVMVVPIVFGEEVLGTLLLRAQKKNHTFGDKEINLCRIVANASYPALRNAQMFEEMKNNKEVELKDKIDKLAKYDDELASTNEALMIEIEERKKAEKIISASLKEKEVLLKEIHHRVKNNLQVISSILNIQCTYIDDKELQRIFKESQNRIKSMALIHEKLYMSRDLSSINFSEYAQDLASNIFNSYTSSGVRLRLNIEDIHLNIDNSILLGLILNELCTNALKHGFPAGGPGEIIIELQRVDTDRLTLIVSDDGAGLPKEFNIKTTNSMGLLLVKGMVDQLEGTLEVDAYQGAAFRITFPG
jgi:two-component sensor histidine kinase